MVEIIKEPNAEIDKNLFLKELSKSANGITLKINKVSDAIASNRNKKEDFIYIEFIIKDEFKAPLKKDETGAIIPTLINVTDDIIAIPFTLNEVDASGNYMISRNKNIFNILNYALKEKCMISENNHNSFKANYNEIKTALSDLEFKATANLVKSRDFNDYYKLEVLETGENME